MTSPSLTEFLLARIAEDEAAAWALVARVEQSPGYYVSLGLDHPDLAQGDCPSYLGEYDPHRAISECSVKRRIVARHAESGVDGCYVCAEYGEWGRKSVACVEQRLLALPYADHPDYRDEWKP